MAKPKTPRRGKKAFAEKDMYNYMIENIIRVGQTEGVQYSYVTGTLKMAQQEALKKSGSCVRIFKVTRELVKVVRDV